MADETKLTRQTVKEFLQQYRLLYERRRLLERRRQALLTELHYPSLPSSFKSAPVVSGSRFGDGAVGVVYRLAEIEERLNNELLHLQQTLLQVLDLIALLPDDSLGRAIIELRHIDRCSWDKVAESVHLSRSRVYIYYNAALDRLLKDKKAASVLQNFLRAKKKQDTTGHLPVLEWQCERG